MRHALNVIQLYYYEFGKIEVEKEEEGRPHWKRGRDEKQQA